MKIVHRICIDPKKHKRAKKKFEKLGIPMMYGGEPRVVEWNFFDMAENDPLWPDVRKTLCSVGIKLMPTWTVFTEEEILAADLVWLGPHHIWGYPMPKLHDEWRGISFNAGQECPSCGIGREQIAPIHLKSEPKLGRNHFMAIFWTYDIFARNIVFDILSQNGITGFEPLEAIHHRKGTALETIKQLKITEQALAGVVDDNLVRDKRPCGHIKYNVPTRGMPKVKSNIFENMPDLVRTHEWFGSGHGAFQLVLASSKFVKLYIDNKWRGLALTPLELI